MQGIGENCPAFAGNVLAGGGRPCEPGRGAGIRGDPGESRRFGIENGGAADVREGKRCDEIRPEGHHLRQLKGNGGRCLGADRERGDALRFVIGSLNDFDAPGSLQRCGG